MGSQDTQQGSAKDAQPEDAPAATNTWGIGIDPEGSIARYVEQHAEWYYDEERRREDREAMLEIVADWEREHGKITPEEKAEARAILGL